jgi:hypothetical protein
MKRVLTCLVILLFGAPAAAQTPSSPVKPASRAVIEGIVIRDADAEPVRKAVIELIAENQAEGGNYTAVTAADGSFRIEGIAPGRYRLFVERTGLLEMDKHRARSQGRVLTLASGQELKDLQIRMQSAAVVHGRVTDEDGEPMPNANVTVLRRSFAPGHSRWETAGSERTNDLGEYRIANLPAGDYYVSVSPPPDFKSLIEEAGRARTEPGYAGAPDKPAAMTYQTTYYPGAADRSQAAAIPLRPGDEFPVNFSLTPSPSLSIRGSVVNLPPRASASIILQSRDFGLVLNGAEMDKDGSFVIHDVAPGAYTILATVENGAVPLTARQSLQVLGTSIKGLRLAPQPGALVRGRLRLEAKGSVERFDPSQIFLALRQIDGNDDALALMQAGLGEGDITLSHVAADGSFQWQGVPPGGYYVQFAGEGGGSADWFLKSVLAGGRDTEESGIAVNGGTVVLDLVASADGAVVDGVVTDRKSVAVANAVIVAVPEARRRGRADRYRKTVSDQSGRFTLHGLAPGDYTLYAWESADGEAYYDPEFLKSYEGQGTALPVGEGERKVVQVGVIAAGDQP